jgi:hypothetical protein
MKLVIFIIMLPFLIPIVLVALFILKIFLKGKAEEWKGEIIDKNYNSKRDFDNPKKIEQFYSFKVKMSDGKIRNIAVSNQFYNECVIGDVIEKPKGAIYPKKINTG